MGAITNADFVRNQIRHYTAKDISIMLNTGTIQSITAAKGEYLLTSLFTFLLITTRLNS